jgi:hypothetical protein
LDEPRVVGIVGRREAAGRRTGRLSVVVGRGGDDEGRRSGRAKFGGRGEGSSTVLFVIDATDWWSCCCGR